VLLLPLHNHLNISRERDMATLRPIYAAHLYVLKEQRDIRSYFSEYAPLMHPKLLVVD
jgi:hypothetical protein